MFDSLGRAIAHAPKRTIAVWAVFAAACMALAVFGVGGETLFERLTTGAPSVPGSESATGQQLISDNSSAGPTLTLAVRGVDVSRSDVSRPIAAARAELLGIDGVATVIDPYVVPDGPDSPAAAPLVAADGDGFLIVVELAPDLTEGAREATLGAVEDRKSVV